MKGRSLAGLTLCPQTSAVVRDDPVTNGESQARPFSVGLRRIERFEDLLQSFLCHTRPNVGEAEPQNVAYSCAMNRDISAFIGIEHRMLGVR